jgi:hypothetical protein
MLFSVGCSENLHSSTARKDACKTIQQSALSWWISTLWPVVLFAASQLLPWFRRHVVRTAIVVAILGAAFWTPLLMIVSGHLFAA